MKDGCKKGVRKGMKDVDKVKGILSPREISSALLEFKRKRRNHLKTPR